MRRTDSFLGNGFILLMESSTYVRTYSGEDCRGKEDGLNVAPLVDGLLVAQVDAFGSSHCNGLFVLQQLFVDSHSMMHRVHAPIKYKMYKVQPFQHH